MNANEPSAFSFIDNIPLPKAEDSMTAMQKYWYNKGHEDGRNIALPIKTLSDAEIEKLVKKHTLNIEREYGEGVPFECFREFVNDILRGVR